MLTHCKIDIIFTSGIISQISWDVWPFVRYIIMKALNGFLPMTKCSGLSGCSFSASQAFGVSSSGFSLWIECWTSDGLWPEESRSGLEACPHCRRKVRQFVAKNGEKWDCRRKVRQSHGDQVHGENFRESLLPDYAHGYFSWYFNGLLFQLSA